MSDVIDDFWLRFKDGKVVEYAAQKNHHLLERLLDSHENAYFIGEVALVPNSSPISKQGLIWYDSSFDENASCHLALGYGYPQTMKNASFKSEQELITLWLNQCTIHEDFMIGSADLDVTGVNQFGDEIYIFKQGEWNI